MPTSPPSLPNNLNETDLLVQQLEQFFTELVTQTPLVLTFTAASCADYLGIDTPIVSGWLQRYRDVQGFKTLSTAEFVIATFNRGPRSEWFILIWPGMTAGQREAAGEMLTIHEIMSVVKEEIKPMLRNIEVQFNPAVMQNRRVNREFVPVHKTKLDNYRTMVLSLQRDVMNLGKARMKRAAHRLDGVLDATIDEIDTWRQYMATL